MFPGDITARLIAIYEAGELIPVCAWCGRAQLDDRWVAIPQVALDAIDAPNTLSHSICPDCLAAAPPAPGPAEPPPD